MTFLLKLSEARGNLRDYKSGGTPKHGYIRDNEGIYRIDGKNFEIIQRALANEG